MVHLLGVYDYTVILTHISLISGVCSLLLASRGQFGAAVCCIALSGFLDAFDGAVARTKRDRTEEEKAFGIQLDSLCDLVCFGVAPAFVCSRMGVDGPVGTVLVVFYCLCALIRLAWFNVSEANRQRQETTRRHSYQGLPVTSIAIILPAVYLTKVFLSEGALSVLLRIMLAVVGFLFVLDFSVPKPNWDALLKGRKAKV